MTAKDFRPSPPQDASAVREGDRWTLVFVRDLPHPPAQVFRALTDPAELRAWAPFDADRDLGTPGAATFTMAGGDGTERSPATVRRAEPPVLLEYTWEQDLLRWELEPTATGTRLTLRHTVEDKDWIPRVAAGWHLCLDVAERALAGAPVGRIVGELAKEHGFDVLHAAYEERLSPLVGA
ncbi:MAG: SRPBCC family protein [Vicinamibacteria bacterium]